MSEKDRNRYYAAAHAVQSDIAFRIGRGDDCASPKHLRVGVDTAKVEQAALAMLLIEKGIFTLDEYDKAMADAMERERDQRAAALSKSMGANITLQ